MMHQSEYLEVRNKETVNMLKESTSAVKGMQPEIPS